MTNTYPPFYSKYTNRAELAAHYAQETVDVQTLVDEAVQAISGHTELNAFLHVDAQASHAQAQQASIMQQKNPGPLTGIPIAYKDVLVTQDWNTTAASKMLQGYRSPFNATVVDRLQAAGMVNLGKLNCDEFGMGNHGRHAANGPIRNPWSLSDATSSTDGAAAAVAAGLALIAVASDTDGALRIPAAQCGLSAIRPSYGVVSRHGLIAYGSSLDQAGPIARHARDLVEVLDAISGFDPSDATNRQQCGTVSNAPGRIHTDFITKRKALQAQGNTPLKGLRIGVPQQYFDADLDDDTGSAIEAALSEFERLGAQRIAIQLPHTDVAASACQVIASAEGSSNLSRYDGVHFGFRAVESSDLTQMISQSRSQGLGQYVQQQILLGSYVLSQAQYDTYFVQAQRVRKLVSDELCHALDTVCDLVLTPVMSLSAQGADTVGDLAGAAHATRYTAAASLAGLPAMSLPCGTGQGKPIGLQMIGNYFSEGGLLAIADCYQSHSDWHTRTPEAA